MKCADELCWTLDTSRRASFWMLWTLLSIALNVLWLLRHVQQMESINNSLFMSLVTFCGHVAGI